MSAVDEIRVPLTQGMARRPLAAALASYEG